MQHIVRDNKDDQARAIITDLSTVYKLNRQIDRYLSEISAMESAAECTTMRLSGMPHGSGESDPVGMWAIRIATTRDTVRALQRQLRVEYDMLAAYIDTIPDSDIRQIMMYRYASGLTWRQVAEHMGEGYTEDAVRMAHNRYVRKCGSRKRGRR